MKKVLLSGFAFLLFAFAGVVFLNTMMEESEWMFILPTCLFFLFSVVFGFVLIKEILVGHNEYIIEETYVDVLRKGKTVMKISKDDSYNLCLVRDIITEKNEMLVLTFVGKRFFIKIDDDNFDKIKDFIGETPCLVKNNLWYHILSFLTW